MMSNHELKQEASRYSAFNSLTPLINHGNSRVMHPAPSTRADLISKQVEESPWSHPSPGMVLKRGELLLETKKSFSMAVEALIKEKNHSLAARARNSANLL